MNFSKKGADHLFLSRDRLGIKPLYFMRKPGLFAFCSEIRPLLDLVNAKAVILQDRLADSLIYGITDSPEQTIYKDVLRFPSGHSATLQLFNHRVQRTRFWELPGGDDLMLSDEDAIDKYSEILEDSVNIRLRADVPVTITLSGGVDSSAIALAVSRVNTGEPVQAFTSRFPDYPKIDETAYATEVAKHCGLESKFVVPDLSRLIEDERILCRHQELPFDSLSLYVHWCIVKQINQQGIKVIFNGQGGDELFLGYDRYYMSKIFSSFPNIPNMISDFSSCARNSGLGFLRLAEYIGYFSIDRLHYFRRLKKLKTGFNWKMLSKVTHPSRKVPIARRKLQKKEILGEQLSHLLRYDDRNVSAHGLETRLPFLDYRMVEFAYRLSWKFKIRDGWSKWLSRAYLSRHGLEKIARRRNKLSFNAPTADWVSHLWQKRKREFKEHKITQCLVNENFEFDRPHAHSSWNVFNILELALEMNWENIIE